MVCVECIVVPVVVLLLSFASQLLTSLWRLLFPAITGPAPPPFDPSSINLAAHGLVPAASQVVEGAGEVVDGADEVTASAGAKDVDGAEPLQDETKEGPVVRRKLVKA